MFYADSIGLAWITSRLAALAQQTGDQSHRPAPLLAMLAAEGRGFATIGK